MKHILKGAVRSGCAVLILASAFFAFSGSAAASNTGLSIQPLKVDQTLRPGESAPGNIQISNVGDKPVNVDTKIEDFVPLVGTYQIQFVGRAPGITTVRDWITLDGPRSFVLGKGATKNIIYTIKAPLNAEPGGHFGVAFFKATDIGNGNEQLRVGTQVGMLILVTIPGSHLEKGNILGFSGPLFVKSSPINFTIKFENTGTVHFEPKGTLTTTNMFGKVVGSVPVGGEVVLPGGVRDLPASVNYAGVLIGRYTAELKMVDGEGNVLTAHRIAFYAFPVWYVIGFIVTVIMLFYIIRFLKNNVKISFSKNKQ